MTESMGMEMMEGQGYRGRHQNTKQRITKADKHLVVSLQSLAFL